MNVENYVENKLTDGREKLESEKTLGDSEGQGSLACCSAWSPRVRHILATEQQQQNRNRVTDVENKLTVSMGYRG